MTGDFIFHLADARRVCALPGCNAPVVPPQRFCSADHKQAGHRMSDVTRLALKEALSRCNVTVTTGQAGTVLRKVGLGVVAAFISVTTGKQWDSKQREWIMKEAEKP